MERDAGRVEKVTAKQLDKIAEHLDEIAEQLWADPDTRRLGYDMTLAMSQVQTVANRLSALTPSVDS